MEQSLKYKQKRSLSKFLLPNKIPNKVGVAVTRSQSARDPRPAADLVDEVQCKRSLTISKRPLSLNVTGMTPKQDKNLLVSSPLHKTFIFIVFSTLCGRTLSLEFWMVLTRFLSCMAMEVRSSSIIFESCLLDLCGVWRVRRPKNVLLASDR